MRCAHPECTEMHGSNFRWEQLCPATRKHQTETRRQRRHATRSAAGQNWLNARAGKPEREPELYYNEVVMLPGYCTAFSRSKMSRCDEPVAKGDVCATHIADAMDPADFDLPRPRYFRAEDYPEYASMSRRQRESFRKAVAKREKRKALGIVIPTSRERAADALNAGTEKIMLRAAVKRGERRKFIMTKLDEDGFVSTADVAREFSISTDTVKTVLCDLEEEGVIERIYGGARFPGTDVSGGALRRPRVAA